MVRSRIGTKNTRGDGGNCGPSKSPPSSIARVGRGTRALARHIGARLRAAREGAGVPRRRAAQAIGVSLQTYINRENGATELKSAELVVLADLFKREIVTFFDDLDWSPLDDTAKLPDRQRANEAEAFVRMLARVPDATLRREISEAVKAIARADDEDG